MPASVPGMTSTEHHHSTYRQVILGKDKRTAAKGLEGKNKLGQGDSGCCIYSQCSMLKSDQYKKRQRTKGTSMYKGLQLGKEGNELAHAPIFHRPVPGSSNP